MDDDERRARWAAYMRQWRLRNRDRLNADKRARDAIRRAERPPKDPPDLVQQRKWQATYYARNRDRVREGRRRYRQSELGRAAERRSYQNSERRLLDWRFRRVYGITLAEYEAILDGQGGTCAICRQAETHVGRGGRVVRLAVDHDHQTGAVRGLLCRRCNQALGLLAEDADLFRSAAGYLESRRA